jgi:hypothetical protein
MTTGRISLLVDSPLRDLAFAMREVPSETRKYIGQETKKAALPIWQEEVRGRATTRVQIRTLVDTAKVGVTTRNVFLRSAQTGKLRSGVAAATLAAAAEFGMNPDRPIKQRSRRGKVYSRRIGNTFGYRSRAGKVVFPAAAESIPRFASLWIQTASRALYEADEKVKK